MKPSPVRVLVLAITTTLFGCSASDGMAPSDSNDATSIDAIDSAIDSAAVARDSTVDSSAAGDSGAPETPPTSDSAVRDLVPPPPDPCIEAGSCAPGVWTNVTPAGVDLTSPLDCGNYGTISVQTDPMMPSDLYAQFNCQGIWKSTDYGQTWRGPINTGAGGKGASGAGGIVIPRAGTTTPPVIYYGGIRGSGVGFGNPRMVGSAGPTTRFSRPAPVRIITHRWSTLTTPNIFSWPDTR